jgi:membrane protein DedA with SNARE-associated domain
MDWHRLIVDAWPYFATFGWTFIEGETFLLFAAAVAAQGRLSAPLLLLAAWFGSFAGDQCYFWIGRRFGLRLLSRRPAWRERVDRAMSWLKRYDAGFILSFRFIYGVRNVASFALGISGVSWRRFMLLNFVAALVWASVFVGAGYSCGKAVARVVDEFGGQFRLLLLGVFAFVVIAGTAWHRLHHRRKRQRAASAASTSS